MAGTVPYGAIEDFDFDGVPCSLWRLPSCADNAGQLYHLLYEAFLEFADYLQTFYKFLILLLSLLAML